MKTAPERPPIKCTDSPEGGAPTQPTSHAHIVDAVIATMTERFGIKDAPERRLLRIDEVADRLTVSVRTVETLVAEGELVPLRIRGSRRFTPEAVDAYLRTCATGHPRRRRSR